MNIRLTNGNETFMLGSNPVCDERGPIHGTDSRGCGYTRCEGYACDHEHAPQGATVWHDDENTEELWEA